MADVTLQSDVEAYRLVGFEFPEAGNDRPLTDIASGLQYLDRLQDVIVLAAFPQYDLGPNPPLKLHPRFYSRVDRNHRAWVRSINYGSPFYTELYMVAEVIQGITPIIASIGAGTLVGTTAAERIQRIYHSRRGDRREQEAHDQAMVERKAQAVRDQEAHDQEMLERRAQAVRDQEAHDQEMLERVSRQLSPSEQQALEAQLIADDLSGEQLATVTRTGGELQHHDQRWSLAPPDLANVPDVLQQIEAYRNAEQRARLELEKRPERLGSLAAQAAEGLRRTLGRGRNE